MEMPEELDAAGDAQLLGSRVHMDMWNIPKSCPCSWSGADTQEEGTSPGQVPLQGDELPVLPSTLLDEAAQGEDLWVNAHILLLVPAVLLGFSSPGGIARIKLKALPC